MVEINADAILAALPIPVLCLDQEDKLLLANPACETLFQVSTKVLLSSPLRNLLSEDSAVFDIVETARNRSHTVTEDRVHLHSPRFAEVRAMVIAQPVADQEGSVLLIIVPERSSGRYSQRLAAQNSVRSVASMASILAHEIKNPLSGMKGAAQLLEMNAREEDAELARLIIDEGERIVNLVDSMEHFTDTRPLETDEVNIHEVLDHVRLLATQGFASGIRFTQQFDPSLPPILGNRDALIQLFINLVKNAAEAIRETDQPTAGEIVLSTRFDFQAQINLPNDAKRLALPLQISVQDNGIGIKEEDRDALFDAFYTTKRNGKGLGLSLVAKIVDDHAGAIDVKSRDRRTVITVSLPMAAPTEASPTGPAS